MNFFYNKNAENIELEKKINLKIIEFIDKFSNNIIFKDYILSFGIIWPSARGEWFYITKEIRSDIDLYLVTNYISLKKSKQIQELFNSIFENELDVSLLFFSPNSFKKPDLMMFELTNSWVCLYWKKLEAIDFKNISKFESVRNLVYRWFYFLDNFEVINNKLILKNDISKEKFLYWFSKVVFALWEVWLILDWSYTASNFNRAKNVNNCKLLKNIDWFLNLHNLMHNFRFENKDIDFKYEEYSQIWFNFLLEWYKLIFKELFNSDSFNSKNFKYIKATWISFFSNRILYFINMFLNYKIIKIYLLKEPFIDFVLDYISFLEKMINWKKIYKEEFELLKINWKTSPWIYYKI